MTLKELRELIALMEEHNLLEVEIEREGMRIRLKKAGAAGAEQPVAVIAGPVQPAAAMPAPTAVGAPQPAAPEPSKLATIKSPMVGTFYRAPAPDAPPFVEVGHTIEAGQVVCIIEAMKLMNEIKSDVRGTIREIAVENGQPVEFGQALFAIEPA